VSFSLALLGESARAERALTVVTEGASRVGEQPVMVAHMHSALAARATVSRNRQGAADHYEHAARAFESMGAVRLASGALNNVGAMYSELGAHSRAVDVLRRALALADKARSPYAQALARLNLGVALACTGSLEEGIQVETLAISEFESQLDIRLEATARSALSQMFLDQGDLARAEQEVRRALTVASHHKPARASALTMLAQLLISQERFNEALEATGEGMGILAQTPMEERESLLRVCHAEALWRLGFADEARKELRDAADLLDAELQRIDAPELRETFRSIPEHRRTFELRATLDI
jgi:ATP/maltotriose-dependent transcriptional regulator MalT